jgi:Bacterial Ig domain/Bacterial Ig-like domain (group 3)
MVRGLLRVTGTALVIVVALATPVLVTATWQIDKTGAVVLDQTPTTSMLVPSGGATVSGSSQLLDAIASGPVGMSSVTFELSGGTLSNQVVATATSTLWGWIGKWNTTTVTNGTYTLQSVATDIDADIVTSAPITITVNNPPPTTSVLIPSNGATQSGVAALLDASASANVNRVDFELSGGTLSHQVISGGFPTIYGWLGQWNTTSVPNGTYNLQSVASYLNGVSTTSAPTTITVNNPPPMTAVLIPSNGATQSGTTALLDSSASSGVTSVTYELTGGTLINQVIATGTPTLYGWLAQWNTTTVPNGTYDLTSVASYAGSVSGPSPGITVTVANPGLADLANSSFTVTGSDVVGGNGCSFVYGAIDAVYPGSAAVGNVTLHIAGCATPSTFTGSFTITTGVGTLSGSATGPIIEQEIGVDLVQIYQVTLSVEAATGSFAGTTGDLLFSTSSQANVGSLTTE